MKTQKQLRRRNLLNLAVFTAAALGIGWLGIALDRTMENPNPQQGLGILVWILGPMAAGLLLRTFGGDGWSDSGIRPNLKSAGVWYLAALLAFPLASLTTFGIGFLAGAFTLPGFESQGVDAFLALALAAFAALLAKNIFEEFAWRGYLTPRFEALGIHPMINHLLTGLIWAAWHIPYWLYFADRMQVRQFTSLDMPAFILQAFLIMIPTAVTFGEIRLLSRSVWPTVVLHSVANAVTQTLLFQGFIKLNGGLGILLSPGNDGIVCCILFGLIGLGLYLYRTKKTNRDAAPMTIETRADSAAVGQGS
jgi:membrane protease YdiL (CAAX protease family)